MLLQKRIFLSAIMVLICISFSVHEVASYCVPRVFSIVKLDLNLLKTHSQSHQGSSISDEPHSCFCYQSNCVIYGFVQVKQISELTSFTFCRLDFYLSTKITVVFRKRETNDFTEANVCSCWSYTAGLYVSKCGSFYWFFSSSSFSC